MYVFLCGSTAETIYILPDNETIMGVLFSGSIFITSKPKHMYVCDNNNNTTKKTLKDSRTCMDAHTYTHRSIYTHTREDTGGSFQTGQSAVDFSSFPMSPLTCPSGMFLVYADGSCNNLSPFGEGGAAYKVFLGDREIKSSSTGFLYKTNNYAEKYAIMAGIASVPEGSDVCVVSDSLYAIKYYLTGQYKRTEDDLSLNVRKYCDNRHVHFFWVKGHSGEKHNEEVDKLARKEMLMIRKKYNIPVYSNKNSPKVMVRSLKFR